MSLEYNICTIEKLAIDYRIDFVTVKGTEIPSELVLNPHLYPELDFYAESHYETKVGRQFFRRVCQNCGLCVPKFEENYDVVHRNLETGETHPELRIKRNAYNPEHVEETQLFFTQKFSFTDPNNPTGATNRICFVEDFPEPGYQNPFSESNAEILIITINPNIEPDEPVIFKLRETVRDFKPMWYVSDKGLGLTDGIALLKYFQHFCGTAMLTGEIQTDETRRVADHFWVKPIFSNELLAYSLAPPPRLNWI
jgi:hypothetical protein